jgi:ATP-dependent exoDNAse (exonuclease V) beta subunit
VVVGDAKQSIYRFRRAEVRLFRRASERARRTPGHEVLQLTQNFRSRPSILRFANRVFGELIQESQEAGQPAYEPIVPPPGLPEEPSVVGLEFEADFLEGEELLAAEAAALVRWLGRAAKGKLEVRDPATGSTRSRPPASASPSREASPSSTARRSTRRSRRCARSRTLPTACRSSPRFARRSSA